MRLAGSKLLLTPFKIQGLPNGESMGTQVMNSVMSDAQACEMASVELTLAAGINHMAVDLKYMYCYRVKSHATSAQDLCHLHRRA